MAFFQKAPALSNLYQQDSALQTELSRRLSPQLLAKHLKSWDNMGRAAAGELQQWLKEAESNPPKHIPFDAWGRRVDLIETSPAWERFKNFSAETGIVAIGYDKDLGSKCRVLQTALLYLFSASSATYSCPLAMTDAAARVLIGLAPASLRDRLVPKLLSRDGATFITSGQWMTERTGGSDVSNTETIARRLAQNGDEETYTLHGVKWFTSATTAEMALTLARIADDDTPAIKAPLTLFCVELNRKSDAGIQGVTVNRLKDKLGTRALPTAELTLDGVIATRIGPVGRGVASISSMLNITRYYNAVASASSMGLSTLLVKDYAAKRFAFDKPIGEHLLHAQTIDGLEASAAAAMAMCFEVAELIGKTEVNEASDDEVNCLRALIPITKLLLGKQAVAHASETLECFGGAGYIEDTGLPRLLRDAQVLPIWEGTTNVLSLDVLRAEKKQGAFSALLHNLDRRIENLNDADPKSVATLRETSKSLFSTLQNCRERGEMEMEKNARRFSISAGLLAQSVFLGEAAPFAAERDSGAEFRFVTFVLNQFGGLLG